MGVVKVKLLDCFWFGNIVSELKELEAVGLFNDVAMSMRRILDLNVLRVLLINESWKYYCSR